MWQVEVPAIKPMWRSSATSPSAKTAPSTPSAPAWASIRPHPTWHAVVSPSSCAAAGVRVPSGVPIALAAAGQGSALHQIVESNPVQKIRLPTRRLVRQKGPFAGHGAAGAVVRPAGAPRQKIREIQDAAIAPPLRGQMALQPHQLRDLHLGRHGATDEVEHGMAGRRAFLRLGDGTVVQPHHGIPSILAGGRDARRLVRLIERDQRAGRIEADPRHRFGLDSGALPRLLCRRADRPPDVIAIVLGMVGRRSMEGDLMARRAQHVSRAVEQTGPGTAGADIDAHDHPFRHGQLPSSPLCAMPSKMN